MITIRQRTSSTTSTAREALLDAAFGAARFQQGVRAAARGPAAGAAAVVRRRRTAAASSAPRGCGTSPPGRRGRRCCSARSPCIRTAAASGHRQRADASARWPTPSGSAIAPCCWSATRPTTGASASRPRRPAACGCPAATTPTASSRCELAPGALDGARGLVRADRTARAASRRCSALVAAHCSPQPNPRARPEPPLASGVPDMNALTRMTENHRAARAVSPARS